jgi:predicted CXXCH cytochrome family protein
LPTNNSSTGLSPDQNSLESDVDRVYSTERDRIFTAALTALSLMIVLCCGLLTAQTRPAASEPASVTARVIRQASGAGYVGADACRSCHKPEFAEFNKTAHASLPAHDGAVVGCETCHGAGKPHADAEEAAHGDDAKTLAANKLIFSFKGNPKQNAERCQQCHQSSKDQAQFDHSNHAMHGVSCNDCHATHLTAAAESPTRTGVQGAQAKFMTVPALPEEKRWLTSSLLKKNQPELCYQCHGNIRAAFALPTHHRVPEGAMKCTDCHTPHGTSNKVALRQSGWETCTACHAEKRGPMVFEHSAVKVEGCTACHTPHGSTNKMLLVRREERMLCLQCHVDPAAANVPHSRLSFQTRSDCTRCHSAIHGSNFNQYFLN